MSETAQQVAAAKAVPPGDGPSGLAGAGIAANTVPGRTTGGSSTRKGIIAIIVLLALFAVPFVANTYVVFVVSLTLVYAVSTLGFNLLVGWSGQIGLAHAALFAVGAYGSAIGVEYGIPFLLTIPLAGIVAAVLALVIGFPAIRLRGFFLAIATLALGMAIVELLTMARPLTGGGGGMSVNVWSLPGITTAASTYFVVLAVAAIMFFLMRRALLGRFGRTLQAVRDLGQLTGSLGVSALRYRLVAFALSGFIAAVAGTLYGQLQTFIFPAMFQMNLLVPMLVMVFVGGAGSMWGPVVGAAFAIVLIEFFQDLGDQQAIAYGLVLMLAISVLPGGLTSLARRVGDSRFMARLRRREVAE
ncbi:branched-chain amino acid ABC transporter permease [Pseudonocardia thermophila]|jgi:ABC-type branched-chain amino acid transport system, permease component|uniref:branched-chain amino acid ABC transporter permease n=1 Tax=Pseudonocardia thermophila TaxID=1848 RepID=UPI00248D772A|nr:branched-chain amino acid ABC transporter permease [Pseudonocardia thermophila]